jgi:hypothetical protein
MDKQLANLEEPLGILVDDIVNSQPNWEKPQPEVTRAQARREWMSGKEMDTKDLENLGHLFDVFNTTPIRNLGLECPLLSEYEIDQIADEVVSINAVQDMLDGRKSALRSYVFEAVNTELILDGMDPEKDSGYLKSPEYGVNLSKEVSGGKPVIDMDLLETVLDHDQFKSICNVVTTTVTTQMPNGSISTDVKIEKILNEEALEKQIKLANIGMEQILQATTYTKTKTAFYVRKTNKTEV